MGLFLLVQKIKENVKSEYRSILEFDLSVGRSLTMTTAGVPQKESSKFRSFL